MKTRKRVIVVGAGVGGLTAAMRLAHAGFEVELFEKNAGPGGRCGRMEFDGFRFDVGPTILLMPFVLEAAFKSVGRKLEDELEMTRCDPHYRVHYRDGSRFTLWSDPERMSAELEKLEPGAAARYQAFLAEGATQHSIAFDRFVTRHFDGLSSFVTPTNVPKIVQVGALQKLWGHVSKYFEDDRLKQALSFQSMYLGLSPWDAPAVFALLPYTEAHHGIWFPKGGLHGVPLALERVCREEGVRFHYSQPVEQIAIEDGRAIGVRLPGGEVVRADAVLCNADYAWACDTLLAGPLRDERMAQLNRKAFTASSVALYLGVKGKVDGLLHHNVFFGRGFKQSFNDIFKRLRMPEDVSFYVNAPSRTEAGFAPEGDDALYVLVPAPNLGRDGTGSIDWNARANAVRQQVLARLAEEGYGDLSNRIVSERVLTPQSWADDYSLSRGSNFGLSQNLFQIGPFRPRVTDPSVAGLFWCGASIQPGTGVPTVMLSAGFAMDAMVAQLGESLREAA